MKAFFFVLFLVSAGVAFFVGYGLGWSRSTDQIRSDSLTAQDASPDSIPAPSSGSSGEPSDPDFVPDLRDERLPIPSEEGLAARAALRVVTLIDKQGRELVAEILEVREGTLQVRRQADFRIVEVPVNMLSEPDRIFAEFLWARKPKAAPEPAVVEIERGPDISERALVKRIRDEF